MLTRRFRAQDRWLVSLIVAVGIAGCGGAGTTTSGDGGVTSEASTGEDGGATADGSVVHDASAGGDGSACVTIDPASFARSCNADTDCMAIQAGTICTGGCSCGGGTISKSAAAAYQSAISSVSPAACPCANPGRPACVQGTCAICRPGAPGCPDAG